MYNIEEVRNIIEENGCKLITEEYINSKTKMEILCSCGKNTFWASLSDFKNYKNNCGCRFKKTSWTIQKVKEYANTKGVILISDEYKGLKSKLKFKCKSCGESYIVSWDAFLNAEKYTCNSCSRKRVSSMQKYKYNDVKDIIEGLGSNLLSTEYVNSQTLLEVECMDCKKSVFISFSNIKHKKFVRCAECGRKITTQKQKFTYEHVREIIKAKNCKLLSKEYNTSNDYLSIECSCGNEFTASLSQFQVYKSTCDDCREKVISIGEKKFSKLLDKNNIKYIQQYTFDDCKYKIKLRYDFYLIDYKILIEIDGIQHREPIKYFGGKEAFEEIKIKDEIKNKYCEDNKIMLIRIPYQNRLKGDIKKFTEQCEKEIKNILNNSISVA